MIEISRFVNPPHCVQLEPVEGCSLSCSFCGIQSIRENGADAELGVHGKNSAPYRFMESETVATVARQAAELRWNPRWEFAMHGEPSMNHELALMVKLIRRYHPRGYIMVTSNGSGFLKNTLAKVQDLFNAGLNTLALDDYKQAGGWVDKIRESLDGSLREVKRFEYPKELDGNPHKRHNGKMISFVHDISENAVGTHQLTNQGGNSFIAKTEPLAERCAKPFRELSIRWDGAVALCCDDWPGVYKIGNVRDMSLEDIWYSPRFEAARRRLYAKDRAFGPCRGCNVRTVRNGLLPDKMGKAEMPEPDAESHEFIKQAMRGRVLTIKLNKWD